ncbi:hypothetical protein DPMN_075266 [Dreissena polymorpha]|uniref:Uncharacterized protein n=1 Tax=Dreissena polymorpha TaxID=45954 RepID=A0A9D4BMH0_DREPO|nr:hypothetical protein DPMN_075266 [Dreissena polymorpha]
MSQDYVRNPMPRVYVWRPIPMPQVYVWRPIPVDYICMETYVLELCMETYVSENFVMTPSLCDSLP